MVQPQNILVFGATGYKIIENKPSFGLIVIFTSPDTLKREGGMIENLKAHGVEILSGDITKKTDIVKAYEGIDAIFSALGRNVITEQINLIKLATTSPSVKRFFQSEYGTDIEYCAALANGKPHQRKLKARAFINTVTDLGFTSVVTGPYSDAQLPGYFAALPPYLEKIGSFDVNKRAILLGDGKGGLALQHLLMWGKLWFRPCYTPLEQEIAYFE